MQVGVDPANGGAPIASLNGRVFLCKEDLKEFAVASGKLMVELWAPPAGHPHGAPERLEVWEISKEQLNSKCLSKDVFGLGYTLHLPWPTYRANITEVQMRGRYEPADGIPRCARNIVTLTGGTQGTPVGARQVETDDHQPDVAGPPPDAKAAEVTAARALPEAATGTKSVSLLPVNLVAPATLKRLATDDKETKVTVAVIATSNLEKSEGLSRVDRELAGLVTKHLNELCAKNGENVVVLPVNRIERYKTLCPDWNHPLDLAKVGKDLKVRYVIYLEINALSLYMPRSNKELYQGETDIKVSLVNVGKPDDPPEEDHTHEQFPESPRSRFDTPNPAQFRHEFFDHVAEKISGKFTKHPTRSSDAAK